MPDGQKKSWYETGYNASEKEVERRELAQQPDRYWLIPGASKQIVFLDDDPFCLKEHSWKSGEEFGYRNATCIAEICDDGCEGCKNTKVGRPDFVGLYSMVDVTGYVSKQTKKEHKFELKVLPAKTRIITKLKMKKEQKGSLIGLMYQVTRTDKGSAATGDEFEFVREVDMAALYRNVNYKGKNYADLVAKCNSATPGDPEAAKLRKYLAHNFLIPETGPIPEKVPAFNFLALCAPKTNAELRTMMAQARGRNDVSSGSPSGGGTGAEDDIPF